MKLFIAEKPSLTQAIEAGIGVEKKSNGYISVNGGKEIVTWCYGHILVQLNPNEYAEKYRIWQKPKAECTDRIIGTRKGIERIVS